MGEVKRESDCTTLDHWRIRAIHLEAEWARCSQHCAVIQTERDTLRAKLAASEAACAAKDAALRVLDVESNSTLDSVVIAAALALDGGSNYIDASGAVEGRVQKLSVPASGWAGGTSLEHVTIPRDWAGSRVLIVRVAK